jgi:hypothetical protein
VSKIYSEEDLPEVFFSSKDGLHIRDGNKFTDDIGRSWYNDILLDVLNSKLTISHDLTLRDDVLKAIREKEWNKQIKDLLNE